MLFAPLGRRRQREFLGVPAREQDRALRPPAAARELAERPGELHQRSRPARWIDAAIDPRVAMVAHDHHVVGSLASDDHPGDGPDFPDAIVGPDFQAHDRIPGLEDHARVLVRQRRADDGRKRHRFGFRDAARAGYGWPPGRERVAGHHEVVHDAAALDVALRSPGTFRVHRPLARAVVFRIGIDQDPGGASLLRRQGLEAAIAVRHRVADERDLAADVDAAAGKGVVVGRIAAARVDDRRGDFAGRRVRVIRKPGLLRRDLRVRIFRDRILAHRRAPGGRRRHLDDDFLGPRQQDFVGRDLDALEAELDEPIARVKRQLAIAIGSGDVRLPGVDAMLVTNAIGRGQGQELPFELGLGGGAVAGEPEDRRRRPVQGRDRDQRGDRKGGDDGDAHRCVSNRRSGGQDDFLCAGSS